MSITAERKQTLIQDFGLKAGTTRADPRCRRLTQQQGRLDAP